jgi:phosphohistidine swiveling domain-containing protein
MISKKIKDILSKHTWKEEEAQASIQIFNHWVTCYVETKKAYKKDLFSVCIYVIYDNYGYEWVSKEESKKVLDWCFNQIKKDNEFFRKKIILFEKISKKITKMFLDIRDNDLNVSNHKLKEYWLNIKNWGREQYGYAIISECADILDEKDYKYYLKNVPESKIHEVLSSMSGLSRSFMDYETISLIKLAMKEYSEQDLKEHVKNFFWIQNSFSRSTYLDETYFKKSIHELRKKDLKKEMLLLDSKPSRLEKKQKEIINKYRLSDDDIIFFRMIREFSEFQDKRKENIQKMVFCIDKITDEIVKRRNISKKELEKYTIDETAKLLENGDKIDKKELDKRTKAVFIAYYENKMIKEKIFFDKDAQIISDILTAHKNNLTQTELEGFVASKGGVNYVKGKVRVVFDPIHDKFYKGEILVTGMTRPEFVPLMKKAKAIVTNEGGITTHAAIISRELNVSCIISTKIATKIFKNGDTIKLDMRKGIVRKINK